MLEQSDFLTADEVAAILRLPRSTVYKLTQDRVIPAFKVGKHWRYRRETINEWIKKQENEHSRQGEKLDDS